MVQVEDEVKREAKRTVCESKNSSNVRNEILYFRENKK